MLPPATRRKSQPSHRCVRRPPRRARYSHRHRVPTPRLRMSSISASAWSVVAAAAAKQVTRRFPLLEGPLRSAVVHFLQAAAGTRRTTPPAEQEAPRLTGTSSMWLVARALALTERQTAEAATGALHTSAAAGAVPLAAL